MGTTSVPVFLPEEGLPFGRQSGASPAIPSYTPFGNSPILQTAAETELLAQITSLQQDMAKLQEHNNLLSSKAERQRSPIRVNAHLRDSRMRVLGNKSPIRKVQGLESMVESDPEYVPSKLKVVLTVQQHVHDTQRPSN
ncbi:unnamed protein product [Prunus brigantina]